MKHHMSHSLRKAWMVLWILTLTFAVPAGFMLAQDVDIQVDISDDSTKNTDGSIEEPEAPENPESKNFEITVEEGTVTIEKTVTSEGATGSKIIVSEDGSATVKFPETPMEWNVEGFETIKFPERNEHGSIWVPAGKLLVDDIAQFGQNVVIEGAVQGDIVIFGGNLTLSGQVSDDVALFGGNADITGYIGHDLVVTGGNIDFSGSVRNDLAVMGGNLDFGPGSVVGHDVACVGGNTTNTVNAAIGGEFVNALDAHGITGDLNGLANLGNLLNIGDMGGDLAALGILGAWLSFIGILMAMFFVLLWIGVGLLLEATMSERLETAGENLKNHPVRNVLMGLLWYFIGVSLTVIFGVLCIILIGIPFLLALIVFWLVLHIFGMVVVFRVVGRWICERINQPQLSNYAAIAIGVGAMCLIHLIPVLGGLCWILAAMFGIGSVLMSRFGKRSNGGIQVRVQVDDKEYVYGGDEPTVSDDIDYGASDAPSGTSETSDDENT